MGRNFVVGWNRLDSVIFKIEQTVAHMAREFKESREELPNAEEMIEAATKQLQEENNTLKKLHDPGKIICLDNKYYCPHCNRQIANKLVEDYRIKFCPECGKRIVLSIPYPYKGCHG